MLWNWIKKFALKEAIREMSGLTPLIAAKVRVAQSTMNSIPPDEFAAELVLEMQEKLCDMFSLKKEDVLQ